jgi:hypothetical protein
MNVTQETGEFWCDFFRSKMRADAGYFFDIQISKHNIIRTIRPNYEFTFTVTFVMSRFLKLDTRRQVSMIFVLLSE